MTRFIAVLGKGGVGKTTISVNLAVALHNLGKDIILIDCNFISPDIGMYLGTGKLPVTLSQVFEHNRSIFESIYLHASGIKIVPSEGLKDVRLDRLKNIFDSLKGAAEIVLIDTGAFGEAILELADEILIVTGADMMSVTQAAKVKKLAEEKGLTVLGTVLNKFNNYGLSVEDVEKMLDMPLLVNIPDSNDLKTASFNKQAIVNYYPRINVSRNFNILAEKLSGEFIGRERFFDYILKGMGFK